MTKAIAIPSKLPLVAGTALLLAAFPAFGQTGTQSGNMNDVPATTSAPDHSSGNSGYKNPGMSPKTNMESSTNESNPTQNSNNSANWHRHMHASGRSDTSQNAAIDRLNEQSYQAAQQGKNFAPGMSSSSGNNASDMNSDATGYPSSSGSTGQSGGKM